MIYFDALPLSLARPCRGSTGINRESSVRKGSSNLEHVGLFVATCWAPINPDEWRIPWVDVATSESLGVRWKMHQGLTMSPPHRALQT